MPAYHPCPVPSSVRSSESAFHTTRAQAKSQCQGLFQDQEIVAAFAAQTRSIPHSLLSTEDRLSAPSRQPDPAAREVVSAPESVCLTRDRHQSAYRIVHAW